MARRRRSRAEWAGLVQDYRDSGEAAAVAAERLGVRVSTLRWWASQLRDAPVVSPEVVELIPVIGGQDERSSGVFRVRLSEAVELEFEVGTDAQYVALVVGALGRC